MNKLSLNSVEWKSFRLSDIFTLENCKCNKKSILQIGQIPYVGATNRNNGVMDFIKHDNSLLTKGNCIAFICDGEGSIGYSIYKYEDFIGSTTIKVGRNKMLNKFNAMFITTVADKVRSKYNFGFKRNLEHLSAEKLLLPIDEKGEPNWVFMENYIKQIMNRQKSQIINYYKSQLSDIAYGGGDLQNSDIEWKEFTIGNVFDIVATSSGIDKNKLKLGDGKTPYITRSDLNNGINLFIPYKQDSKYKMDCGNVITIGLDTQTVFYQNCEFYTGQNIQIAKHFKLNKYNAFFFIPLIKKQMEKFNWGGNGATLTRLKRTKILLPIDEKGEPNWKYMENYVKQKLHSQAKQIIRYYEN